MVLQIYCPVELYLSSQFALFIPAAKLSQDLLTVACLQTEITFIANGLLLTGGRCHLCISGHTFYYQPKTYLQKLSMTCKPMLTFH